jgi:hypothetical protein
MDAVSISYLFLAALDGRLSGSLSERSQGPAEYTKGLAFS